MSSLGRNRKVVLVGVVQGVAQKVVHDFKEWLNHKVFKLKTDKFEPCRVHETINGVFA